jgi:hypothetical protein
MIYAAVSLPTLARADTSVTSVASLAELAAAYDQDGDGTIDLNGNTVYVTARLNIEAPYTITNGTLKRASPYANYLIRIAKANTTLTLENVTIDGNSQEVTASALIRIDHNTSSVIMNSGTVLQNSKSIATETVAGSAVSMTKGTFTMNGGVITGCEAGLDGTVYIVTGNFIMNGGEIKNNTAANNGGGVYIKGNDPNPFPFTMNGGRIFGNTAGASGSAVYIGGSNNSVAFGGAAETEIGGSIHLPPGKTLSVTPAAGYSVVVDDVVQTPVDGTVTISGVATSLFIKVIGSPHDISISDSVTNGTVSASPASAAEGDTVMVTVTPDDGYRLVAGSLKYTADGGVTYTEITVAESVYSFVMPAADVTVTAQFEDEPTATPIWDGTADTSWYTANLTSTSYTISTPEQLAGLSYLVNATEEEWTGLGLSLENPDFGEQHRFTGKTVTLANDIWLNATTGTAKGDASQKEWTPIGGGGTNAGSQESASVQYSFSGTFDGAGHTVYNVYIDKGGSDPWSANYGFFGLLPVGGMLKNLTVTGFVDADRSVGGILGKNWGTVENCVNYATVKGYQSKGVGGIVGANWYDGASAPPPVIRGCVNYGAAETAYQTGLCGGIAGDSEGIIENCANYGTISAAGEGTANIGGITGNIKSVGGSGGGIVKNCFNAGAIIRGQWAAGVVAQVESGNATILNCYNTGSVTGGGHTDYVGGILGNHKAGAVSITNCYNVGAITAVNNGGAIAGNLNANNNTVNLYYLTGSSALAFGAGAGTTTATATSKSAAQMQEAAFAAEVSGTGRSFVADTTPNINGGYPIFRWQTTDTGTLTSIVIIAPPTKTVYNVGQSFVPAGMMVTAYYDDGTSEPVTSYTFYPNGALTSEDTSITVSYSGQTAIQPITVMLYPLTGIAVKTPPTKTFYAPGNPVDPAGLVITATYAYNDETITEDLSEGLEIAPAVLAAEDTEITISYTAGEVTKTTTHPIKVGNYPPAVVDSVYQLGTADDMLWFANFVNVGGNVSNNAALTGDIDLSGVDWKPIGTGTKKYSGTFAGGGHQITLNLTGGSNQGLFGYVAGATIKDLTVAGSVATTGSYVAGLVARAEGVSIENCVNKATVSGGGYIAGILGYSTTGNVNVTGCANQGAITATATNSYAGGIAGYITDGSDHIINNCINKGVVTGKNNVGGILSYLTAAAFIADCLNEGAVNGARNTGGVVGNVANASVTVTRSGNTAAITGTDYSVGGIAGNSGTYAHMLSLCYNTGNVSSTYSVGGILGSGRPVISNCYNTGGISASAGNTNNGAGGIAGSYNTSAITNCYSTGAVAGTGSAYKGAVVGKLTSGGSTANCYYLEGSAAAGVGNGTDATTSKTEAELKSAAFTVLLGAEYIAQDNAYPILAWQGPAAPTTYNVTVDASISGGFVGVNPSSAAAGDTVTVTVTPETGKQLVAGSLKYNEGADEIEITATEGVYSFAMPAADVTVTAQFSDLPENPKYTVTTAEDTAVYEVGETGGVKTMTVKTGVTGMKYFSVQVTPVRAHEGQEAVVFVHLRDGVQLSINVTSADFDLVGWAQSGFDVQPGDTVRVYVVDDLTNDVGVNPVLLQ